MPTQQHQMTYEPGAGRLPTPPIDRALSPREFQRIALAWRQRGAWLSLWNSEARLVEDDIGAGEFWSLWRGKGGSPKPGPFLEGLADCARRVIANGGHDHTNGSCSWVSFGPCCDAFRVAAVAVQQKRRCIGVMLAVELASDGGSEAFQRLCNDSELDYGTMKRVRSQHASRFKSDDSSPQLLALAVEQAREIDNTQNEIHSLTNNLDSTYEELHLIYEISRLMGIPQKPAQMLERVSREMLEVSRAAGIAFVLNRAESSQDNGRAIREETAVLRTDRIVQVGDGAPSLEDVVRLDSTISIDLKLESDHVVCNQAYKKSEYQWAESWLRHFVVLPLKLDGELLGSIYAINVIDAADYTSVDIQLLKAVADRISAALKNQNLYDDLADLLMGLMHALVNSVDAKDPYTFGHSERVAFFSRAIAQAAGLSQIDCERVYLAGLLHDVGKIGVPDAILTKPGKLTAEEFESLKKHPEIGERILSHIRQLRDLLPGVLYHHERMDGRGYPHGLAGRDIPILGRIICLADSFDAMTSNRTYRAALPIAVASAEIRRCAGNQFDPELAEIFLKIGPQKLYDEAKLNTKGDPELARIGAFCAALSARPTSSRISSRP